MNHHKCVACIDARKFGLILNDATIDNSIALQDALNRAGNKGKKLCLPAGIMYYDSTLNIPAGVTIIGLGTGKDPLNTSPVFGSVLAYTGNAWAIEIKGHEVGLRDLVIDDKSEAMNGRAQGAVRVLADNRLVEGTEITNVHIVSFIGGAALQLQAINSGGIPYGLYTALRIRSAKTGISILEDESSFVNANRFITGVISGGGFTYGLHVNGGNNNIFYAQVIEPAQSTGGHIVVENGEVTMQDLRLEGNMQAEEIPLIQFASGTKGSEISGFSTGKGIRDNGHNFVNMRSNSNDYFNPGTNLFFNSPFKGFDAISKTIPYWEIVNGTNVELSVVAAEILPEQLVLEMNIPAGIAVQFRPQSRYRPQVLETQKYYMASFGAYMKVDYQGGKAKVFATHQAQQPLQPLFSSYPHPGDGAWRYIGMTANVLGSQEVFPQFFIDNTEGTKNLEVAITTPSYVFGLQTLPQLEAPAITAAGGVINGMLSTALKNINADNYIAGTDFLILPREGNVFMIAGTNTIARLNHQTADQLPVGTVVTLLFLATGLRVQDGAYIDLYQDYLSASGSSLTLVSNALGTWKEIGRNL